MWESWEQKSALTLGREEPDTTGGEREIFLFDKVSIILTLLLHRIIRLLLYLNAVILLLL